MLNIGNSVKLYSNGVTKIAKEVLYINAFLTGLGIPSLYL
jgi:hypothetical protein